MKHIPLAERIGVRKDMPELTEEQRADLRDRLARDNETAKRLREAVEGVPCRSGNTDCTVDCGWCKGTGREVRRG